MPDFLCRKEANGEPSAFPQFSFELGCNEPFEKMNGSFQKGVQAPMRKSAKF